MSLSKGSFDQCLFSFFFYLFSFYLSLFDPVVCLQTACMPLPLSLVGGANLTAIFVCYLAVKQWDVETYSNSQLSISAAITTR